MSKDYYKVLGVNKDATKEELKKAFKKLAMQYHPDRPEGDEKKFKEINEAYQVLGDEKKRGQYDQYGSGFEEQGGFGGGANWEDFMNASRQGGGGFQGGGIDLGDLFGGMFGGGFQGGGGGRQEQRGRDIQVDVTVSLKEAAFGIEKNTSLRKQSTCEICHGSGGEPGSKIDVCSTCKGRGQVTQVRQTMLGNMQTVVTCPTCHGRGEFASQKCRKCGGDGIYLKAEDVKFKIPAGIDDGQSIRLTGKGEAAPHGGVSGDLYVHVRVKPEKGFHRDGANLYSTSEINFSQAVLGDKIEVSTIEGPVKLVVPAGTQPEQLIRMRGRGMSHLNKTSRGDQYVKIKVIVSKKVNRKIKKFLEENKNEI